MDIELFGLIIDCPLFKRSKDCPFIETELLTFEEKYKWLIKMDSIKKRKILIHHYNCLDKRENNI
jgi:hypothetical protein